MAMTSHLDDFNVDAETTQVLDLALEMTRTALGLADDFANGIIGKRIIELARAGERRPVDSAHVDRPLKHVLAGFYHRHLSLPQSSSGPLTA
jgi:hypothetical protein